MQTNDLLATDAAANDADGGHIKKVAGWHDVHSLAVDAFIELSRRNLLGVTDGSDNARNSKGHAVLDTRFEECKPCDVQGSSKATKEENQREGVALLVHGVLLGCFEFGLALAALHASQCGKDAISDAGRQRVGPLADGLRRDTYCVGSGCDRSAEHFYGASFKHDGR